MVEQISPLRGIARTTIGPHGQDRALRTRPRAYDAGMVALAAVRQALYIFGAVFQSTRDMVHNIADRLYFCCGTGAGVESALYHGRTPIILSGQSRHPRESQASIFRQGPRCPATHGITVFLESLVYPVPLNLTTEEQT